MSMLQTKNKEGFRDFIVLKEKFELDIEWHYKCHAMDSLINLKGNFTSNFIIRIKNNNASNLKI